LHALIQVPDEISDKELEEGIDAVGEKQNVDMWLESSEPHPMTSPVALGEIAKGSSSPQSGS